VSESHRVQALLGHLPPVPPISPIGQNQSSQEATAAETMISMNIDENVNTETSIAASPFQPRDLNVSGNGFSRLTQFEMNELENDLDDMDIVEPAAPPAPAFSNMENFSVGVGGENVARPFRRNHRRSYRPPIDRATPRSHTRHPLGHLTTRRPPHGYSSPHIEQRHHRNGNVDRPSARVIEIRALRRRLHELRRADAMVGYPYTSDAQEATELYYDYIEQHENDYNYNNYNNSH